MVGKDIINMYKKNRKGFTLIELVIVIAVIGVLSSILIPVFINLTKDAKSVSNKELKRNINVTLKMKEGEKGSINSFPSEALNDLLNANYKIEDLLLEDDILLWHENDNQFYLASELDSNAHKEEYYSYVSTYDEDTSYSLCALEGFPSTINNVKVSIDTSMIDMTSISLINNINNDHINKIYTKNGTLKIDGNASNAIHYGRLNTLSIISSYQYEEKGTLDNEIKLKDGHFICSSSNSIPGIYAHEVNASLLIDSYQDSNIYIDPSSETKVTINDHGNNVSIYHALIDENSLKDALDNGGKYYLEDNISIARDTTLNILENKEVEINLHGHNISQLEDNVDMFTNRGIIRMFDSIGEGMINYRKRFITNVESGEVVIDGGRYLSTSTVEASSVIHSSGGAITINGGYFDTHSYIFKGLYTSRYIINGGTFNNVNKNQIILFDDASITINDGTFTSSKGILDIRSYHDNVINNASMSIIASEANLTKENTLFVFCFNNDENGNVRKLTINDGYYYLKCTNKDIFHAYSFEGDVKSINNNTYFIINKGEFLTLNDDGSDKSTFRYFKDLSGMDARVIISSTNTSFNCSIKAEYYTNVK